MGKWLSVVGIGEDGLAGLSPTAHALIDRADVIVGGDRHLAMLSPQDPREKIVWTFPIATSIAEIIRRRGQAICVLASGDPMCYGIGVTLTRHIQLTEMTIIPAPSAFSLACSRLGWALTEVETLSLCGRDPALLNAIIYPSAKLLLLSADRHTPAIVAELLTRIGFGGSEIAVLERMGGKHERIVEGLASTWCRADIADLNTIAIACVSDATNKSYSRLAGLPDTAYEHDGQLTKREVRAVTLAALAPLPGQLLWDVGAGCGSIGIEWLRSNPRCRAIAIEHNCDRLNYIARNAAALGTPQLEIVAGKVPIALQDLPEPDAIFIGGGITTPNLFEYCWDNLRPGGRLVANVVTVEGEQVLFQWQNRIGGELTRIAIQRVAPVGKFMGWLAMSPVTQLAVTKNL
jgi:precorrin-6B C5,15-methyltransferase / cobalt-precorrin-6B C5,C15-methyltransferase